MKTAGTGPSQIMSGKLFQPRFFGGAAMGCIVVFAATFVVFWPALDDDFVNWDDPARVAANPHIQGFSADAIYAMAASFCVSNYTPVERFSCALDYQIWGMNPWGFHFTNIVLHSANAALVFLLMLRLFAAGGAPNDVLTRVAAGFAALMFSLHPLRVESVAWISERRDVLSLFWLLVSTLVYLKSAEPAIEPRKRRRFLCCAWISFAVALFSKATGVTLPLVWLLLDFYPLRRFAPARRDLRVLGRCVLEKTPFLLISLVVGLIAVWGQTRHGAMISLQRYPWDIRIVNAFGVVVAYVQKTVLPWPLSPLYGAPPRAVSWLNSTVALNIAWGCLFSFYSIWMVRRRPAITAAWWSFGIMILPLTGLLQAGIQMIADRYTYLSTIPFALLAGAGLRSILRAISAGILRFVAITGCIVILGALALRTRDQLPVWENSRSLWNSVLQEIPNDPTALNNAASALIRSGDHHLAQVMSRETVRLHPRWDLAWHHHGLALSLCGRRDEAVHALRRSLELNPGSGETHFALGNLLLLKGESAQAGHHYFCAIQDVIANERLTNLGAALAGTGQAALAMKYLSWAALRGDALAYILWAKILAQQNAFEEARSLLSTGYRHTRDPSIVEAHRALIDGDPRLSDAEKKALRAVLPSIHRSAATRK